MASSFLLNAAIFIWVTCVDLFTNMDICLPDSKMSLQSEQGFIRGGYVLIKEAGLRSFLWSKRFLVLRDQMLTVHKNEVL
jgi:hypothetical protein